jgi:two-component system OmpR family response regulator
MSQQSILVVDDDLPMRKLLSTNLRASGYAVRSASDGSEALKLIDEHPFDLVLLDLNIPGPNGLQVLQTVRRTAQLPILMLSGYARERDRVEALDLGADDYLTKPFSFVELAARLRALLRRADPARPSTLRNGDLWLDVPARRARRAGTDLSLSMRELALLELFLRHPGVLLTRTRIREEVWDSAFDGDSNVVDQYVSYLRRKVDRPFGRRDIETVRGAGYRLRPAEE